MNILHIIDDPKFIEACKLTFSIDGVRNFYVSKKDISMSIINNNNIEAIFVHFLTHHEVVFLKNNKISIPIVWLYWGADAFSLPLFFNNFVGTKTKYFYQRWLFKSKRYRRYFSFLMKDKFRHFLNFKNDVKDKIYAMNSFHYIVPIIPQDYTILKSKYPFISGEFYHFNYVTSIFLQDVNKLLFNNGKNVLLGNSATITNNHIEALDKLNLVDMANRKVIVPLTYGNSDYKGFILDFIKNYRNFEIEVISEFMEFDKYTEIIGSCEIIVMNHYRQQALGNIILGLIFGCSIYLSEKSSIYYYLIDNGIKVYSIENLGDKFVLLGSDEKIRNRNKAVELFGPQRQHMKVANLLQKLKEK